MNQMNDRWTIIGTGVAPAVLIIGPFFGWQRTDTSRLAEELGAQINSLRTELKAEIEHLRTELKAEIKGVRAEIRPNRGCSRAGPPVCG